VNAILTLLVSMSTALVPLLVRMQAKPVAGAAMCEREAQPLLHGWSGG